MVECPRCGYAACVTSDAPPYLTNGKLTCAYCAHVEKAADMIAYRVTVKRNCGTCGQVIAAVIPRSNRKVEELAVTCTACGETRTYHPRNESYALSYPGSGHGVDPVFGLPLWLRGDVKGQALWAYNRAHLNDMKRYVASKLRERLLTGHNTMVERLPQFIKEAKNREAVLKALEKMERR